MKMVVTKSLSNLNYCVSYSVPSKVFSALKTNVLKVSFHCDVELYKYYWASTFFISLMAAANFCHYRRLKVSLPLVILCPGVTATPYKKFQFGCESNLSAFINWGAITPKKFDEHKLKSITLIIYSSIKSFWIHIYQFEVKIIITICL